MNPLLKEFDTPFQTPPFEEIRIEHYLPAVKKGIEEARKQIDEITANPDVPDFENTMERLENSGETLSRVTEIFFNLNSAETSDEIQELAREISPMLSEFNNDIVLNEKLFARIKAVYEVREELDLDEEQMMLLTKSYRSFTRNGALLQEDKREKLRTIDNELSRMSLQFGENVLKDTNAFHLEINDEEQLQGLPETLVEAAAEIAEEVKSDARWVFTLHYPSYIPFMTYSSRRELREKMLLAYGSRAFKKGEVDNREIVMRIASLRYERARLLGFKNHADYILQERMAQSPEKVQEFLDELAVAAKEPSQHELEKLTEFAVSMQGPEKLQKWDFGYYSEKLKKARYDIDDEKLKPYFRLEKVIEGAFTIAQRLYGLSFIERKDIQKYHPDVITYEVLDDQSQHLAIFYADFFPRKGKRNGAWMTSYRAQKVMNGVNIRPHISIVCNFTKPTKKQPSLLTFNEVLTLFHEFGHSLHGILANSKYASLSGTSVYWDFVELPSQLMENWCYEKEALDLFASHYETGEKIPREVVERLKESATFMQGYATMRQIGLAKLDMAWHATDPSDIKDVAEYEKEVLRDIELLPWLDSTNTSCSFNHIFQGGYSAGYYSYKWAEVLDADAFEYFRDEGIFNPEVAGKFKGLLSAGGTKNPMDLYRSFRGKEPDAKALLRRAGLIKEN